MRSNNPIVAAFLEDDVFVEALRECVEEEVINENIKSMLESWDFSDEIAQALENGDKIKDEVEKRLENAIEQNDVISNLIEQVVELRDLVKKQGTLLEELKARIIPPYIPYPAPGTDLPDLTDK